jgi:predicted hydrocarbon binding protein
MAEVVIFRESGQFSHSVLPSPEETMNQPQRKYEFSWDIIGPDFDIARPSMGPLLHIAVYRLLQFTMRDILEQRYGTEAADKLFFDAGTLAGRAFYQKFCSEARDVGDLVKMIEARFRELGMGIFRVEVADPAAGTFTFVVDEDLDCSGLPDTDDHVCIYDEGFIKGILDSYTGECYDVREIDCWCSGARTCRFGAQKRSQPEK